MKLNLFLYQVFAFSTLVAGIQPMQLNFFPPLVNTHILPVISSMTLPEVMIHMNYPLETHYITTEDGYINTFFRIQAKNQGQIQKQGLPVIYFQHGLQDTSDSICLNKEESAPALMLANKGYDVWLGNSRGSRYSKNHTSLSVNDKKYWHFTFQEMGIYDVPAAFTYIARETGKKINYIGHSQGTIQMFIALSRNIKEVEDNLLSYIALGPVSWLRNIKSAYLKEFADNLKLVDLIIASGIVEFSPFYDKNKITPLLCEFIPSICSYTLKEIMDMNPHYDNIDRLDVLLGHLPGGTSTWNMRHWGQIVRSGEFDYCDYGKLMNLKLYGSDKPPKVSVERIRVAVHLFVGQTDELADVDDVAILRKNLISSPNVTYYEYPFGHASFLIAKDVSFVNDIVNILDYYN